MAWVACCTCSEPIHLSDDQRATLKRNQGAFHCLWGHSNYFPAGPTEAETLRRERDRLKQEAARLEEERARAWRVTAQERERAASAERRASAARGQVTKLKKRAAAGTCPCCNRTFVQLARHMEAQHPGFIADAAKPEAGQEA